jgi:hypothetical protein
MTTPFQPTLQGTYISQSNVSLPFEAYVLPDHDEVMISFLNNSFISRRSMAILELFPKGQGERLWVTRGAFNKFKENVIDKDVDWKPIIKINTDTYKTITIPGRWTSKVMPEQMSAGRKRSGKSGHKKSNHKSRRSNTRRRNTRRRNTRRRNTRRRNSRCTTHRR